jgi:hypothetical protein
MIAASKLVGWIVGVEDIYTVMGIILSVLIWRKYFDGVIDESYRIMSQNDVERRGGMNEAHITVHYLPRTISNFVQTGWMDCRGRGYLHRYGHHLERFGLAKIF